MATQPPPAAAFEGGVLVEEGHPRGISRHDAPTRPPQTGRRRRARPKPAPAPLAPELLYQACDEAALAFNSTVDLDDLQEMPGQSRALGALQLAAGIRDGGYNLYVMGSPGLGKHAVVLQFLQQRAAAAPAPDDWCYVNDFRAPHRPQLLRVPGGTGAPLQRDMRALVKNLLAALPAAFERDDYRDRMQAIHGEFKSREEKLLGEVAEQARALQLNLIRTPAGFTVAPAKADGELLGPDDFGRLAPEQRAELEQRSETVHQALGRAFLQLSTYRREHDQKVERLDQETTSGVVALLLEEVEQRYRVLPQVMRFLSEVKRDMTERGDEIRAAAAQEKSISEMRLTPFNRYYVNVLVDNGAARGAPLVYEIHPTVQNLVGRIEHLAQMGTLLTDFTLIKSGALHRANGGYLLLDARKLLTQPFAWEALKRALQARELRIESLEHMLSLASTISLEPESVPLDVKVVLIGDRALHHLLSAYDPDFGLLFKVQADFAEDLERSGGNTVLYARLIATLQRREHLRPMDRSAVARLIEQAARLAGDGGKLSLHLESVVDWMRESDHWAGARGAEAVRREDVDRAIDERFHRADQIRERMQESILRNLRLIDTRGSCTGQVNGLSVVQHGTYNFGTPSRITATARLGDGKLVDIEREVELGGPIHSKGVLILSSYLGSRYGSERPLSLAASLVFEQSYGPVEGDSASAAELCALLSALSGLSLRQDLAITGSVNQLGRVQVIGGVNEKIEGFFELCAARGLSGTQGVIIPEGNVRHLMLRRDVVEAARAGRFHVHVVAHVDQAMELLTGVAAGTLDERGKFPPGSINAIVQRRLAELGERRRRHARKRADDGADGR